MDFRIWRRKKTLILSINGEVDLIASRRRRSHMKNTCYKVKIRDTDVAVCKKRGDLNELLTLLNK